LLRYTYSPLKFLEEGARRYGDSFLVKFSMYGKFIILASPEAVRQRLAVFDQKRRASEDRED